MKIKMKTDYILRLLKEHRENHIKEYDKQINGWKEAMEKYRIELAKWTESISANIFDKDEEKRPKEPYKPSSFIKDYDKLIELVGAHSDVYLEIDESEYDQIVKDEFRWQGTFLANSATYSN